MPLVTAASSSPGALATGGDSWDSTNGHCSTRGRGSSAASGCDSRGGFADRNSLLTFPSFARQRGHSSLLGHRTGLYTVSRQLGQFRYAIPLLLAVRSAHEVRRATSRLATIVPRWSGAGRVAT